MTALDHATTRALLGRRHWLNSGRVSDRWECRAMWDAHDLGFLLAESDMDAGRGCCPTAALVRHKVQFQTEPGTHALRRLRSLRAAYLRAYRQRFRLRARFA